MSASPAAAAAPAPTPRGLTGNDVFIVCSGDDNFGWSPDMSRVFLDRSEAEDYRNQKAAGFPDLGFTVKTLTETIRAVRADAYDNGYAEGICD